MVVVEEAVKILLANKWEAALLLFFLYQLYWPSWLHPSEPKLRKLFLRDTIGVLIEVVAQLACLHPDMDEEAVKDDLGVNGEQYRRRRNSRRKVTDGGSDFIWGEDRE